MKKYFFMDCKTIIDSFDGSDRYEDIPILTQLKTGFHLLFCPECSLELKKMQRLEEIMKTEFFPGETDLSESVMESLNNEINLNPGTDAPAGFSFRGWVITGFFMLLSLVSVFFGVNFIEIAEIEGLSFLLPIGLTIGMILTGYGAFFIGSHLKEISMWFRLR